MPPRYPKLPTLLVVALLTAFVAFPFPPRVEAKGKKGRGASRSRDRSRKQISSSGRSSKKHERRGRYSNSFLDNDTADPPTSYPVAPDRIEVIEYGAAPSPELARQLNPPPPRSQPATDDPDSSVTTRRKGVNIDQSRTLQIQQALNKRGFYNGE